MRTTTEQRFLAIKDRYLIAYEKYNNKKIDKLWFEKGWVYLKCGELSSISKHRISQFELMCETLEARQKAKETTGNISDSMDSFSDDKLIRLLMDKHKITHKRNLHLTEKEERSILSAMRELKNQIIKKYKI